MRRLVVALVAFVVAAAVCLPASASVYVDVGQYYKIGGQTVGSEGPFLMTQWNTAYSGPKTGGLVFSTFCVEKTEYFYPNNVPVYFINGMGLESVLTNRTLTGYSAWLYSMYLGVDGYSLPTKFTSSTLTDKVKSDRLQFGIWAGMITEPPKDYSGTIKSLVGSSTAEQEWGKSTGNPVAAYTDDQLHDIGIGREDFKNSTWAGYASGDESNGKYGNTGNILVLNTWGRIPSGTGNAQDQLGYNPDYGAPPVPEPISFVVWALIGLCG